MCLKELVKQEQAKSKCNAGRNNKGGHRIMRQKLKKNT